MNFKQTKLIMEERVVRFFLYLISSAPEWKIEKFLNEVYNSG